MVMLTEELRAATDALSRFLVARATLGETLQRVAELALAATPSAQAVGLTLLEGRRKPVTVFASDAPLSSAIDHVQYQEDVGPCVEAYRHRTVIAVGDTATVGQRWPGYARAAVAAQVGSTVSLPLAAGEEAYGALNLYARRTFAFADADIEATTMFATQASTVLANASAYWDVRDLATGLEQAMKTRAVIEQAKGKLMASGRYTADEAFDVLVRASQRANVRVRDLAARIVDGSVPELGTEDGPAPSPAGLAMRIRDNESR
jgi:GAF domain-containing protein